ncbi:MAG: MarR family winged helix-turn-helix transcriptional regulator [Candidatus Dormibacteraceae bacterium]
MSQPSTEDALAAYKTLHRAMLNSSASRWRDLDISMQQLRAIYLLRDEEEASVGRLAELFGIGLPAASVLADRLVRAGYVERRADPSDRRRVLLSLTRVGLRLVTDLREGSHSLLRRWMSSLSEEDLAALARGWRALAEVASHHGQPMEHSAV